MEGLIANSPNDIAAFNPIQMGILILFTFEIVIKSIGHGWTPHHFFYDNWNVFDFAIVVLAWVNVVKPLGPVTVLRLLRLLRVVRLLHKLPSLQAVVQSLLCEWREEGVRGRRGRVMSGMPY